jgi:hypothetical protein
MGEALLKCMSHIHDPLLDNKLQSYDLFDMAHLELALHFLYLDSVDVLNIHLRSHSILFFNTNLSLYLVHLILVATFNPKYGSIIVYGQIL